MKDLKKILALMLIAAMTMCALAACGGGESLYITELQAEGGKRMAAGAYLLGHPMEIPK